MGQPDCPTRGRHTDVGVISAPALHRRWWAGRGLGAHTSVAGAPPRRLSVSAVADLGSASLSFSSLSGWADRGLREHFLALTDTVWRVRAFGDFFSYCLLAEGAVDIAAEPEVKLWDLAPLDILIARPAARSPAWPARRAARRRRRGHQRPAARRGAGQTFPRSP